MAPSAPITELLLARRQGERIAPDDALNLYRQRSGDLVARDGVLGLSEDTVLRDWCLAKGWPLRELARSHGG